MTENTAETAAPGHLLLLGAGYTARRVAREMLARGWTVTGTTRAAARAEELRAAGIAPVIWPEGAPPGDNLPQAEITDILVSVAPRGDDGALIDQLSALTAQMPKLRALIYYSSTGACGDHGGDWITEETAPTTTLPRGKARLADEAAWRSFGAGHDLPVFVLRLSGIYGPGRSAIDSLMSANPRPRVCKEGQVFNRMHVADIAAATARLLERVADGDLPPHRLYHFADDEPAPPQDVIAYAAELLGKPVPPLVPFAEAELSPMARSFYAENKRIRNDRMKQDLLPTLSCPTYRDGLAAILRFVNPG